MRGGWYFSYLIFSKFIIFTLEIILPIAKLCLKKNFFFCHHSLMKKCHPKLSKNEYENIP